MATYLLKTLDLAAWISSIVAVGPVSILLNQPDVAYNFVSRMPFLNILLVANQVD